MMTKRTKGQIEAVISEEIIKFEKDYMGRGPSETKTYILDDMIFVRLKGVMTPAEEQLTTSPEGAELIKRTRLQLLEKARRMLGNMVFSITSCQVVSLHSDISTRTGERIIIFVLDQNLEKKFEK